MICGSGRHPRSDFCEGGLGFGEFWGISQTWGIADLMAGNGTQRGYFMNEHPRGDRLYFRRVLAGHFFKIVP
jgi:hypothetical protein